MSQKYFNFKNKILTHKVNIQARIKRHSRILKDNLGNTLHYSSKKSIWYKVVAVLILLLFPLYPAFASIWDTRTSFYRWDIDESSIISSYELWNEWDNSDVDTLFESKDSFLSVGALVEDDNSLSNEMIVYEVKKDDTLGAIAQKYDVSRDTIIWANNLDKKVDTLKIWTKLIFPPVTWVVYNVKKWDTISEIAKKYWVYSKEIVDQNWIKDNYLKISQKIIIPGWKYIKEEVIKKPVYTKPTYATKTYKQKASAIVENSNSTWMYPLTWRKPFSWAWGNCTWYVASYKNVNWRWNANQWLKNARAKWHSTGMWAVNGSIIVLGWRWYNRRYGHVWIVREVHKNHLIISDMNYRRLNQVTVRKINRWNNSTIKWYIYVK